MYQCVVYLLDYFVMKYPYSFCLCTFFCTFLFNFCKLFFILVMIIIIIYNIDFGIH